MTRKKVLEYLNGLERDFPVRDWKVYGIDIWPVVRLKLSFMLMDKYEREPSISKKKSNFKSLPRKLILIFISIGKLVKFGLMPRRRVKVLFASHPNFRVKYRGRDLNKFFDPLVEDFLSKGNIDYITTEFSHKKENVKSNQLIPIRSFFPAFSIISRLSKKTVCLPKFETVKTKFFKDHKVEFLKMSQVIAITRDILTYSKIFKLIFQKFSPEIAFQVSYYSSSNYGLNFASSNKILTIDMQHGNVSTAHPAYGNPMDLNVMPDKFWLWDDYSLRNMKPWGMNRLILGGNPWVNYFKSKNHQLQFGKSNLATVLYTLQPIDNFISDIELEVISKTQEKYNWLIRLHPRQRDKMQIISSVFEQKGILRYRIQEPSELPLPVILGVTDLQVTKFSSTILEASYFGIHTLLTDSRGREYYEEIIQNGLATYHESIDSQKLLKLIELLLLDKPRNSEVPNNQAEDALRSLGILY